MTASPSQKIVLGSGSPRRKQLLEGLGWNVKVIKSDVDETYPDDLVREEIPIYLAAKKAQAFANTIQDDEWLITADTIVWLEGEVLGKPVDREDAEDMLDKLQGKTHQVFTGVCLTNKGESRCFSVCTDVTFHPLDRKQIADYVEHYRPFDKAGAYGAQEGLRPGFNPLSQEERDFLQQIHKTGLFESSLAVDPSMQVPIIRSLNGSYFNVMGLPLVELWREWQAFSRTSE